MTRRRFARRSISSMRRAAVRVRGYAFLDAFLALPADEREIFRLLNDRDYVGPRPLPYSAWAVILSRTRS